MISSTRVCTSPDIVALFVNTDVVMGKLWIEGAGNVSRLLHPVEAEHAA
jgi:hypothetical protein